MHKARINALKQQGLPPQEIAYLLGVSKVTVNADIREIRDEQARAAALRLGTERTPHG